MLVKTYMLMDELLDRRLIFRATVKEVRLPDLMTIQNLIHLERPVYTLTTVPMHMRKGTDLNEVNPPVYPVKTKVAYGGMQVYYPRQPVMFKAYIRQLDPKKKKPNYPLIDDQFYFERFSPTTYEREYGFPPYEVVETITRLGKGDSQTVLKTLERIDYEEQEYERQVVNIKTGETVQHILAWNLSPEWLKQQRDNR